MIFECDVLLFHPDFNYGSIESEIIEIPEVNKAFIEKMFGNGFCKTILELVKEHLPELVSLLGLW